MSSRHQSITLKKITSLALLLSCIGVPYSSAWAATEQSEQTAKEGVALYQKHEYKKAADKFELLFGKGASPAAEYCYYAALSNQGCKQNARAEQIFSFIIKNYPGTTPAQYSQTALQTLTGGTRSAASSQSSNATAATTATTKTSATEKISAPISRSATYAQMFFESRDRSCRKILFIGNSLTFVNQLPIVLGAMALSSGTCTELRIGEVVEGGATLEKHYNDGKAVGAIRSDGPWTDVVLQDQSTTPIQSPNMTIEAVERFAKEIKSASAQPVIFETWAMNGKMDSQQHALKETYRKAASSSGGLFVPAGEAFQLCASTHPEIELYQDDRHPSDKGTYLAACVFFQKIFNRSPVGLPAVLTAADIRVMNLDAKTAATLQEIANTAARGN